MAERSGVKILQPGILAGSRAAVTSQYALMPPEGIPVSYLPGFSGTKAWIQTSPEMGARFAQMLLEIESGGGTADWNADGLEHFFYVLDGQLEIDVSGSEHEIVADGYTYVPAGHPFDLRVTQAENARLIWVKRRYQPVHDIPVPDPIVSHRDAVPRTSPHTEGRYWQYLLPVDDMAFDMHMNILGFSPGVYFPHVETHIMEHGLYMLEGQEIYRLAGDQFEVQPEDFIWMGPYCPQFFYCTGWSEAAYLLYKDVNRDVEL